MTKPPRKDFTVNVLGEEYQVKFVEEVRHPRDGSPCCGLCDSEAQEILICKHMTQKLTVITFFHELNHAYSREAGMENCVSHEVEEISGDQFAKVLEKNFDFDF